MQFIHIFLNKIFLNASKNREQEKKKIVKLNVKQKYKNNEIN